MAKRPPANDPLLDAVDVGRRVGMSRVTAWRRMQAGEWPVVDVTPPGATRTQLRVRQSDLDKWIASRTMPAAS
jgi:predicted DNA-binding transcriptional regulator AlpA